MTTRTGLVVALAWGGLMHAGIPVIAQSAETARAEPAQDLVAALAAVDSQQVDPFVVEVAGEYNLSVETSIGRGTVAALCGDSDGCMLRMTYRSGQEYLHLARSFATDPQGFTWWLEDLDPVSSSIVGFRDGKLDEPPDQTIVAITGQGVDLEGTYCSLEEKITPIGEFQFTEYILRSYAVVSAVPDCTLRIDD